MKIALSGKQLSGKDTVADYLCNNYGFKKESFAKPIKELAKSYFGLSHEDVYYNKPDKARKVLQMIGNIGRLVDEDFWVDKTLREIHKHDTIMKEKGKEQRRFVISDLRFKHELEKLKKEGFITIRIEAPRDIREKRGELSNGNDISETDLDEVVMDYTFTNDSDLDKLYSLVDSIMDDLKHREVGR